MIIVGFRLPRLRANCVRGNRGRSAAGFYREVFYLLAGVSGASGVSPDQLFPRRVRGKSTLWPPPAPSSCCALRGEPRGVARQWRTATSDRGTLSLRSDRIFAPFFQTAVKGFEAGT